MTKVLWTETQVSNKFRDRVAYLGWPSHTTKIWQGPMSKPGFPDLVSTIEGVTYLLETKKFGKWAVEAQTDFLLDHARAGGVGGVLSVNASHTRFMVTFLVLDEELDFVYQLPVSFPVDFTEEDFRKAVKAHPRVRRMLNGLDGP